MAPIVLMVFALAFFFLLAGVWLLARYRWIMGFLVGTLGLLFIVTASLGALAAWRLGEYEPVADTTLLGTITVRDINSERYAVTLAHDRTAWRYELEGDRWRAVGQRVVAPEWLLFGPSNEFVTLLHMEGRYLRLEDEMRAYRPVPGPAWYRRLGDDVLARLFVTDQLYTPLLPLTLQALFTLEFRADTLVLQGINEPAQEALRR
ncbi:MAG: hypothetical protein JXQ97_01690 [Natronospirillum sp.]